MRRSKTCTDMENLSLSIERSMLCFHDQVRVASSEILRALDVRTSPFIF